jgi:hypothetical protein
MSKLWTAMQSHFRPTAAYTASVVLIEARRPARSPLPVLSRGSVDPMTGRDHGVIVIPSLVPPLPMLTAVVPPGRQPVARIGDVIDLQGHDLDGTGREVRLINDRFQIEAAITGSPPPPSGADRLVQVALTAAEAGNLAVGVYRVSVQLLRSGETTPRETNRLAMTLAPQMTNLPLNVTRDASGTASFVIDFVPALWAGQTAVLVLGQDEFLPQGLGSPPGSLSFVIPNAPVGSHLARLRVDGIESPIIDMSADPPAPPTFLNQRVVIA